MTTRINDGLWAWKQAENNNRMIALQEGASVEGRREGIELAYFGGSAFRITSPSGLTIMIDPWRNPPWGNWDWYLYDFPYTKVDIGVSTHAHFDHDGLHALSANMLLDRPAGTFSFADVKISGFADKHVSDSSHNVYDWAGMTRKLTPGGDGPAGQLALVRQLAGARGGGWPQDPPLGRQSTQSAAARLGRHRPGRYRSPAHRRLPARPELRANRDRHRSPAGAHRRAAPLSHLGCDDARLDAAAGGRMGEDAAQCPVAG